MNVHSLSFRAFKAVMALPFQVTVVIPLILLYCSGWQPDNMVLWTSFLGIAVFLAGLLLAVSTIRLFSKLGNGTLAPWDPTSKMVITGPYAYVRNPMITGVVLILIGEALMLASWVIGLWAVVFLIINNDSITKMKYGVMLINTGRGKLIKTEDLINGLRSHQVGSAALDVYEEEADYFYEDRSDRMIDDDKLALLLMMPNVIVTSHQAFFTKEATHNIAVTTLQNIRDFEEGKELVNEVK